MNLKEKLKQKHKEAIKKIDVNDNSKIKKKKIKNTLKNVYNMKPDDKGAEVPLRSVPELKKSVNESESAFMNRVDRVCLFKITSFNVLSNRNNFFIFRKYKWFLIDLNMKHNLIVN